MDDSRHGRMAGDVGSEEIKGQFSDLSPVPGDICLCAGKDGIQQISGISGIDGKLVPVHAVTRIDMLFLDE